MPFLFGLAAQIPAVLFGQPSPFRARLLLCKEAVLAQMGKQARLARVLFTNNLRGKESLIHVCNFAFL